jgi:hypothetical protein
VSCQNAHQDLHAPQQNHHKEVLHRGALARRRLHAEKGVFVRERRMKIALLLRCVPPHERADAGKKKHEAEKAPEDGG